MEKKNQTKQFNQEKTIIYGSIEEARNQGKVENKMEEKGQNDDQAQINMKSHNMQSDAYSQGLYNKHWGKIKPYWFNSNTGIPKIVLSLHWLRSLMLNILVIALVCLLIPLLLQNHFVWKKQHLVRNMPSLRQETTQSTQAGNLFKYNGILIYLILWACFELIFFFFILVSNPGYGYSLPTPSLSEQISNPHKKIIITNQICTKCQIIMDNSVFHCEKCDICCEGFRHHCNFLEKCIGCGNSFFLSAYFNGFILGFFFFFCVLTIQLLF